MKKILHVLYQSYPNISGSSTRSKGIVDGMKASTVFEPVVLTSPLQSGCTGYNVEIVDGVKYYRTFKQKNSRFGVNLKKSFFVKVTKLWSFILFTHDIFKVAQKERPDIIHAHAMFACGLPSLLVARLLKIRFVYEIRSDWHLDHGFNSGFFFQRLFGYLERYLATHSDGLVVISKGLFDKYGKFNDNCIMVPNGVHGSLYKTEPAICRSPDAPVTFGFIGSVIPLEGIEMILRAVKILKDSGYEILFKIVGQGESLSALQVQAADLEIMDNIIFLGSVTFDKIKEVYSEIDVVVNFRRDEPIAHSVTPLKPIEAMAQRKLVIVSDVKGMTELVSHGKNGLVVECGNIYELARTMRAVSENYNSFLSLINDAYQYAWEEKSWNKIIERYTEVYL